MMNAVQDTSSRTGDTGSRVPRLVYMMLRISTSGSISRIDSTSSGRYVKKKMRAKPLGAPPLTARPNRPIPIRSGSGRHRATIAIVAAGGGVSGGSGAGLRGWSQCP
jgi:hypothetical protein